jgi:hypothetical protein
MGKMQLLFVIVRSTYSYHWSLNASHLSEKQVLMCESTQRPLSHCKLDGRLNDCTVTAIEQTIITGTPQGSEGSILLVLLVHMHKTYHDTINTCQCSTTTTKYFVWFPCYFHLPFLSVLQKDALISKINHHRHTKYQDPILNYSCAVPTTSSW